MIIKFIGENTKKYEEGENPTGLAQFLHTLQMSLVFIVHSGLALFWLGLWKNEKLDADLIALLKLD